MPDARIANARRLRRDMTDAERKLWSIVRNRQLEGYKFRRQVPIDRYIADFVCMEARIVIELDGGGHMDRQAYDTERTEVIERCGYLVLRFTNRAVLGEPDGVVLAILESLAIVRGKAIDE